jgi:ribosome biogenesis GTPase
VIGETDAATSLDQPGLVAGIQRGGVISVYVGDRIVTARADLGWDDDQALTVGDRVTVSADSPDRCRIIGVEPRTSKLARVREDRTRHSEFGRVEAVLAANVGVAVIVAAAAQPAFHPRLVDRFLVICQYGGIRPLLCLNKCDLVEAPPDLAVYEQLGLPIVLASAETGAGVDRLRDLLQGNLAVFTGHSGVGKSSLVNAVLREDRQKVGAISSVGGRGRHTTTSSTLLALDESTFVIDTPGIRSLAIWKIDARTLPLYFPEIERLGAGCHFADCSHLHEPRCAVKVAVEVSEIPRQRYESYVRMLSG